MKIHFVCKGNTFRSRLAEDYFKSLNIKDWTASSSGITASENQGIPICWYTKEIIEKKNLSSFDKGNWTQTSKNDLKNSDTTVFMDKSCHQFCVDSLDLNNIKKDFEIWSIPDINDLLFGGDLKNATLVLETAEKTFEDIKNKVDHFLRRSMI